MRGDGRKRDKKRSVQVQVIMVVVKNEKGDIKVNITTVITSKNTQIKKKKVKSKFKIIAVPMGCMVFVSRMRSMTIDAASLKGGLHTCPSLSWEQIMGE